MAEQFLGELRLMSFNYAPNGWAQCNGQTLPINQNQALFSLLGTTYGGNGQTTFALPDMRGRTPVHVGNGLNQGEALGEEFHTLIQSEMPAHNHQIEASSASGNQAAPSILASAGDLYRPPGDLTTVHPQTIASSGGSQSHENRHPLLTLNWCVALQGIFPSRN